MIQNSILYSEWYVPWNVSLLSAQGICHANVLTTVLFYDKLPTESYDIDAVIASFLRKLQQIITYLFTPWNMLEQQRAE
jgi:hypothetical protein